MMTPAIATQVGSPLILLSLALFALGLIKIYSAVLSSVRAKRKPAYLRVRRENPHPHSRN